MLDALLEVLQDAIRNTCGCDGVWVESVHVTEAHDGATVWDGNVQVFNLPPGAAASRCYVWSYSVDGSERRRFFVALHIPPVDSPEAAVRAAIASDYRQQTST
jgi:hypothetical protein